MQHRRIVKQGPVVLATQEDGSMDPGGTSTQGLFLGDTRFLSRFKVRVNDQDLTLLGSTEEIVFQSSFLQTNSPLPDIPARGIGILQKNSIQEDSVQIELGVANWALKKLSVSVSIEVAADFFDSFEARGVKRLKRGETKPAQVSSDCVHLQYIGLDHVTRVTHIATQPDMARFENDRMYFDLTLEDNER
ncbi:MAG: hypothetical protein JOZ41_10435, partial [Chloroflexi bacterium]|nr:hypothetical protein [Chloroflexota bacterium]